MSLLKRFCNIQSRTYQIANLSYHNLNQQKRKKNSCLYTSNVILRKYRQINLIDERNEMASSRRSNSNCNNRIITSTANEVPGDSQFYAAGVRSRSVQRLCGGGPSGGGGTTTGTTAGNGGYTKESSNSCNNSGTHQTMMYRHEEGANNLNQNSFVNIPFQYTNFHAYSQQIGLLNTSLREPVLSANSVRNLYMFRHPTNPGPSATNLHQQSTVKHDQRQSKADEERAYVRDLRQWVPLPPPTFVKPGLDFTLMSYNVLAQDLLTEHAYLYRQHSPRALLWEYRWKNLYDEIFNHDADIICLQEVQESHLKKYYSVFNKKGYGALYKKRTGMRTDGCAIYYRKSMFKLVDNFTVEYNQGDYVLDRDNVAIIAKFVAVKQPDAELVVATTHLLYNPRRQDVRLAQTQVLLAEIDRMAYNSKLANKYTPVIITGDFNSEPDSAVFKLVTDGQLRYDNLEMKTLIPTNSSHGLTGKTLIPPTLRITDNCKHLNIIENRLTQSVLTRAEESKVIYLRHSKHSVAAKNETVGNDTEFATGSLSHDLNLQPVFLYRVGNDTEATTNQNGWIMVDYIFYSGEPDGQDSKTKEGKLKLCERFSIPTTNELKKVRNIPNYALGSDHLALLSKFRLEY